MKSFGRLLKRLRGQTPLETLGERTGLDRDYLAQVEAGQVVTEKEARQILRQGFALHRADADRLLLGIQLYDLGLKDNALRQLVIGVIRKETSPEVQDALHQLAERYQAT